MKNIRHTLTNERIYICLLYHHALLTDLFYNNQWKAVTETIKKLMDT